MRSTAIPAQGSTFAIDTSISGDPSFTAIKNIKTYSGLDGSASEIDVTNLDSEAKEFRVGLEDNGQFTIELDRDFSDSGQIALLAARDTQAAKKFKLSLSNGENAQFVGYVKKFGINGGVDQVVKGSVDIRITGPVTWSSM